MKLYLYVLRLLSKNKIISALSISGLSIGIASFILIMNYVQHELSYDKFYGNANRTYRVYINYLEGGVVYEQDANTYNISGETISELCPEIVDYVRMYPLGQCGMTIGKETVEIDKVHLADSTFFEVFGYPLLMGDIDKALYNPNSIVLAETESKKIFGAQNPLGKTVEVFAENKKLSLKVTGIFKDLPDNTHMPINYLISFNTANHWGEYWRPNWNVNNYYTFLLAKENLDVQSFNQKLKNLELSSDENEFHSVEPLTDIHLHSNKTYEVEANGNSSTVQLLFAISLVVLLLSWINYSNIIVSQSIERTKEVGIRKVSGASKTHIFIQFMRDSLIYNAIAFIIVLALLPLLIQAFNYFTGESLTYESLNFNILFIVLPIICTGAILSGLYPALLVSKFQPVNMLKGTVIPRINVSLKKTLVVIQFFASTVLIIFAFSVFKQLKYMHSQPLGFDAKQTVVLNGLIFNDGEKQAKDFSTLKNALKKLPFVKSVATSGTVPGDGYNSINSFLNLHLPDGSVNENTVWYNYAIDNDYLNLMQIKLLAGENFNSIGSTDNNKVIINEKARKLMVLPSPHEAINKKIEFWGRQWEIIGVIDNYHHFGLNGNIEPLVLINSKVIPNLLLVKLNRAFDNSEKLNASIAQIEKEWNTVFESSVFKYYFLDEQFKSLYSKEEKFSKAFTLFTILALIIACIGLWNLSQFSISKRTKEIAIRKVNGAKIREIFFLINKEYILWISISFIFAIPISYYIVQQWLTDFVFKIDLSWWVIIISCCITLLVGLLSTSYNSIYAARRNPTDVLSNE